MISKNKIKLIKSLQHKKYREKYGLFVCEGKKLINELLNSDFEIEKIYAIPHLANSFSEKTKKIELVKEEELKKISFLKNPQGILALVKTKKFVPDINEISNEISLIADDLQDPGNFGTIIRTCNWFGIKHIICSPNTVDMYNPKVVQASMGAIFGVKIYYSKLSEILNILKNKAIPIFGTYTEGENIFEMQVPKKAAIVFGNEGKGISNNTAKFITKKISIPSSAGQIFTDSLNVATAVSIVISILKNKKNQQ